MKVGRCPPSTCSSPSHPCHVSHSPPPISASPPLSLPLILPALWGSGLEAEPTRQPFWSSPGPLSLEVGEAPQRWIGWPWQPSSRLAASSFFLAEVQVSTAGEVPGEVGLVLAKGGDCRDGGPNSPQRDQMLPSPLHAPSSQEILVESLLCLQQ